MLQPNLKIPRIQPQDPTLLQLLFPKSRMILQIVRPSEKNKTNERLKYLTFLSTLTLLTLLLQCLVTVPSNHAVYSPKIPGNRPSSFTKMKPLLTNSTTTGELSISSIS